MILGVSLDYWAGFFAIGFLIIVISCIISAVSIYSISQK